MWWSQYFSVHFYSGDWQCMARLNPACSQGHVSDAGASLLIFLSALVSSAWCGSCSFTHEEILLNYWLLCCMMSSERKHGRDWQAHFLLLVTCKNLLTLVAHAAHSVVYWPTDLDDDSLVFKPSWREERLMESHFSITFQWSKASTEVNLPWRKVGWERGVAIWNVSARLRDAREKSRASMMGSLWPGQHQFRWWLWSLPASFLLQPLSILLRSRCTKDWARGGMTPAQNCCPELKWVMHPQKCQMHLSKIFNMTMLGERTWKRLTW